MGGEGSWDLQFSQEDRTLLTFLKRAKSKDFKNQI